MHGVCGLHSVPLRPPQTRLGLGKVTCLDVACDEGGVHALHKAGILLRLAILAQSSRLHFLQDLIDPGTPIMLKGLMQ